LDIITLPIEYDKKKIESKYRLAVIASQRARELAFGAEPRIPKKSKMISTLSLLETISGEIKFLIGEEAAEARERAEKIDFRKLIEDKRKSIHERETTERVLEELFSENDEHYES